MHERKLMTLLLVVVLGACGDDQPPPPAAPRATTPAPAAAPRASNEMPAMDVEDDDFTYDPIDVSNLDNQWWEQYSAEGN